MLCVVSVCLLHDQGATWFRLAEHHGHLGCSHGRLMLVHVLRVEHGMCGVYVPVAWPWCYMV
jgi:hypothetical protein